MTILKDKRFILVLLITAAVAAYFWGASRYPALNEKMMMGTSTPFSGLAFSTIVKISPEEKLIPRILYSTINWAYTNRQGMTFGILFGALMMTLLSLLKRRSFRSRFANAAIGLVFGRRSECASTVQPPSERPSDPPAPARKRRWPP